MLNYVITHIDGGQFLLQNMFSKLGRRYVCPFIANYNRSYSNEVQAVKMKYNIFEGKTTDNSKAPLMIMHGLFGSKQNWRSVGRALESKTNRKIIALDARNHGDSPHTNQHSSMHMTADIVDLMQDMNIMKTSVMGHSMGGRTMMYMALKYPQYVENCVVVDISPVASPRDLFQMEDIFLAMKGINFPPNLSLADARRFAEIEMKKVVSSKETVDFILLNLRKLSDGTFTWAVNVDALHRNLRQFDDFMIHISGLEPYKGRMMLICGNKSNFVDPKSWPQIQKLFPNSEIHWLDAGHLVHYDQPEKFLNLLVRFLNN